VRSVPSSEMPIIDAQIHAYEQNHPGRPWLARLPGPPSATGAELVAAMRDVGVDGAVLVSTFTMYGYDASYAVEVRQQYPERFCLVAPVDPGDPAVEQRMAEWAVTPGAVGVRLVMMGGRRIDAADPAVGVVLAAAARHGLVVNLACAGHLDDVAQLARRSDCQLVVDHLGLAQLYRPARRRDPFAGLPALLALARFPNVSVKLTGVCTLSREPFPFPDIWPSLRRVLDTFGVGRCMWGTDWTRAVDVLSYREGVEAFATSDQLSVDERRAVMGGTATRIYGWSPVTRS
jgi:L-fuconolactonase